MTDKLAASPRYQEYLDNLLADLNKIMLTAEEALQGKQLQPILL